MSTNNSNTAKYMLLIALLLVYLMSVPAGHLEAAVGELDPSFNPSINGVGDIQAMDVQPDGKIIIGGHFSQVNGQGHYGLARLNADGSTDTGFNAPKLTSDVHIHTIALQPDGKLLVSTDTIYLNYVDYIMRLNADGSLDTSFNQVNNIIADLIQVQSDGKIVIAGPFTSIAGESRNGLARLNANGTLDTTFDAGAAANNTIRALAIQTDDKVLIAGIFTEVAGQARMGLARLNGDGTLDSSYDAHISGSGFFGVSDIELQSNGMLLIGGFFSAVATQARSNIARLDPDGQLDLSFEPQNPINVSELALQSDGNIIVTNNTAILRLNSNGSRDTSFSPATTESIADLQLGAHDQVILRVARPPYPLGVISNPEPYFILIQLMRSDGALDTSFKPYVRVPGSVTALAIQSDGKILAAGLFSHIGTQERSTLVRLNTDGSLDTSFLSPFVGDVYDLTLQKDGSIIVAGRLALGNQLPSLIRLQSNGSIDTSFIPTIDKYGGITALAPQSDGKLVIGGSFTTVNGEARRGMARLNSDGTLDSTFNALIALQGVNGRVVIHIQADGKILVGGYSIDVSGGFYQGIVRLDPDGSLDTSFNTGVGVNNTVNAMLIQSDGKIIISNSQSDSIRVPAAYSRLVRLNADGSFDSSFMFGANIPWLIYDLAFQSDGKIVAAGLGLLRINNDGTPDNSFDPKIEYYECACGQQLALAQQVDGKLVVAGAFSGLLGADRHAMARLEGLGEIDIRGQGQPIGNGDTSPDLVNGSDFGELQPGESVIHSFSIHNLSSSPLSLTGNPPINITGPHASDFEVMSQPSATIAPGSSSSFQLRFTPGAVGLRSATSALPMMIMTRTLTPLHFRVRAQCKACITMPIYH